MPAKLTIWNQRALFLMTQSKIVKLVKTDKEFCEKIGFDYTNITKVKSGKLNFQIDDLIAICKFTKSSMDFICGLSNEYFIPKKLQEEVIV